MKGIVKLFNAQRGFGFIAPDDGGGDVFVHISELRRCGLDGLDEGDIVLFEEKVDPRKGKTAACDVKMA